MDTDFSKEKYNTHAKSCNSIFYTNSTALPIYGKFLELCDTQCVLFIM